MKLITLITVLTLVQVGAVNAATIFTATPDNTTVSHNKVKANGSLRVTGSIPDLVLRNTHGDHNLGGMCSTEPIHNLWGASLSSQDSVTLRMAVDSIEGGGTLRAHGVIFGIVGGVDCYLNTAASNLVIELMAANDGSHAMISNSFQDNGRVGFTVVQSSMEDGFAITLTADRHGYSFFLTDIITGTGETTATISGTFTGSEFVDHFDPGHFFAAAQKKGGPMALKLSHASISVEKKGPVILGMLSF